MTQELAVQHDLGAAEIMERVIAVGDLSKLQPAERVAYYVKTCESLGLNPLTKPFEYINLNNKLTLYARKDATDQLRRRYNISIDKPSIDYIDDYIVVTVLARDGTGRTDSDIGVVSRKDMRGDFGNALMKAVTKAKRRVTLSICGLGMLDETEIETIPDAAPTMVNDAGEIVEPAKPRKATPRPAPPVNLAHVKGATTDVDQRFNSNGKPQLVFKIDGTQVLASEELAETWFDLEGGEHVAVTGEWKMSPSGVRFIAASHIERMATQAAQPAEEALFDVAV